MTRWIWRLIWREEIDVAGHRDWPWLSHPVTNISVLHLAYIQHTSSSVTYLCQRPRHALLRSCRRRRKVSRFRVGGRRDGPSLELLVGLLCGHSCTQKLVFRRVVFLVGRERVRLRGPAKDGLQQRRFCHRRRRHSIRRGREER